MLPRIGLGDIHRLRAIHRADDHAYWPFLPLGCQAGVRDTALCGQPPVGAMVRDGDLLCAAHAPQEAKG